MYLQELLEHQSYNMRLNEFYNPEFDEFQKKHQDDTRKPKMTLETLGKLRKSRELQRAEEFARLSQNQETAMADVRALSEEWMIAEEELTINLRQESNEEIVLE